METGRLTSKGQVTIPKAVREHLGVGPSDSVSFALLGDGRAVISASGRPAAAVFGLLRDRPRPRTGPMGPEEMEAVIRQCRDRAAEAGGA